MNIRDELIELVRGQRELVRRQAENKIRIERMGSEVMGECSRRLARFGVGVNNYFHKGADREDWAPEVFVSPRRCIIDGEWRMFAMIDGAWCWYRGSIHDKAYAHKILEGVEVPFDGRELERECAELEKDLGIKVTVAKYKTKDRSEVFACPRTVDDALLRVGGVVVGEGEVAHLGWDVKDPWVLIKTAEGFHLFYATNSHGYGFDHHIEPGRIRAFLATTDYEGAGRVLRTLEGYSQGV